MKVTPLRLPPLQAKNITIFIKPRTQQATLTPKTRKYSPQMPETADESSEGTCLATTAELRTPVHTTTTISDSCKSIRIREPSLPSKKGRKTTHLEDYTFSDLPPSVTAKSWILFEMRSGRTIYGRRAKKPREMASLTKIMHLITTLELIQKTNLDAKSTLVRATRMATSLEGTTANLKHQAEYCLEDLLFGMMLPSGNDAAFLIAELGGFLLQKKALPGSMDLSEALERRQGGFVTPYLRQMNFLAHTIGLKCSHFANVHGLNNLQNISSAEDLARLCSYAMQNKTFRKIVQTRKYSYWFTEYEKPAEEEKEGKEEKGEKEDRKEEKESKWRTRRAKGVWENTNKMLGLGWSGIKTGVTPNAGPCLAASLYKCFSGKQYEFLAVLLDCGGMQVRWEEVQKLIDWAIITRQYL